METRFPDLGRLVKAGNVRALWSYLEANSNLPGPRANLNLILEFTDVVFEQRNSELLKHLTVWLATPSIDAPVNSPAEFPVACAAAAVSAFVDDNLDSVESILGRAAHDDRWRTREGVVLGLQRSGERELGPMLGIATRWAQSGDPYLERAAIATLAHPPILTDRAVAEHSIALSDGILTRLQTLPAALRKTEGNRVLQKGLSYAISVFVAAAPETGFAFLERWLISGDETTRRVINENLGKARLSKKFATETARLKGVLFELRDWER